MYQHIHIMVLKRLLLVWLGLSLVLGGIAYYLEVSNVNDIVLDLVVNEVGQLDQTLINGLSTENAEVIVELQREAERLVAQHFILVEIYKPDETHLVIASGVESESLRADLDARHDRFPLDAEMHYDRFTLDGLSLIQVLIPLKNSQSNLAGYFEGVYNVETQTLDRIYDSVYRTLFLVMIIILAIVVVIYPVIVLLNRHLFTLSQDLLRANVDLMEVLGSAIAMRDSTTNSHNYRVTIYAIALAKSLNLRNRDLRKLIIGAFLHDVGKIGVSDTVLQKGDKLEQGEIAQMRHHVSLGQYIIEKSEWLTGARDVIQYHHEKYDGSGYLNGLKGEQIPLSARVFAVVDVFDALSSKRPYKEAFSLEYSMNYLKEQRGVHFDPDILDKFLTIAAELHGKYNQADDETLEKVLRQAVYKYFFRPGIKVTPTSTPAP